MKYQEKYSFVRLFQICPETKDEMTVLANQFLPRGIVFVDAAGKLLDSVSDSIYSAAYEAYGDYPTRFNNTFHKSFKTVADSDITNLLFQQMMHYLSTYGAEAFGLKVPPYIPIEALDIPDLDGEFHFRFTVIRVLPLKDCVKRLDEYMSSLIAPSEEILTHITNLISYCTVEIGEVKSFEVRCLLYKYRDIVPSNPVMQLRFLVYSITRSTLLIKNQTLIYNIKKAALYHGYDAYNILKQCDKAKLATIFLRYKPIFLAFKAHVCCGPIINQLRRLADKVHQPLSSDSLQNLVNITDDAIQGRIISAASSRDLVKVLNSIRCSLHCEDKTKVYLVRNNKSFVTQSEHAINRKNLLHIGSKITQELVERLLPTVRGRTFLMPVYLHYAVPTSEKQLIGNIPYGSFIRTDRFDALTTGIHWFNTEKDERVDIDLHLNGVNHSFGWNSEYTNEENSIIYTGDLTDAPQPNGAAEAYWFAPEDDEKYILSAHLYHPYNHKAKFTLFMTEAKPEDRDKDYTMNPNNLAFPPIPLSFTGKSSAQTIGMFADSEFYFYGGTITSGIVPRGNYADFIQGLSNQLGTKLTMEELINAAGGIVVNTGEECDVSLMPQDLSIDTLLNIIDGK